MGKYADLPAQVRAFKKVAGFKNILINRTFMINDCGLQFDVGDRCGLNQQEL